MDVQTFLPGTACPDRTPPMAAPRRDLGRSVR